MCFEPVIFVLQQEVNGTSFFKSPLLLKTLNFVRITFQMARTAIIIFLILTIYSCQSGWLLKSQKVYAVPSSFNDTILVVAERLSNCSACNFIIYQQKVGNCFGPSLVCYGR